MASHAVVLALLFPTLVLSIPQASLPHSLVRPFAPNEILGPFVLFYGTSDDSCPRAVFYSKPPKSQGGGIFEVPHNTIRHQGKDGDTEACSGDPDTSFMQVYDGATASNRKEVKAVLDSDERFKNLFSEIVGKKEFAVGFEPKDRKCPFNGFPAGTLLGFSDQKPGSGVLPPGVSPPKERPGSPPLWMFVAKPPDDICIYLGPPRKFESPIPSGGDGDGDGSKPTGGSGSGSQPSASGAPLGAEASEEASPSPDDDPVCFPATATVEVQDGTCKTMNRVQLGDSVHIGNGVYSDVFMFTHRLSEVEYDFVRLASSDSGALVVTSGHYIYVNGHLVAAREARVGDTLERADGTRVVITSVGTVRAKGLFNPQTVSGDIVVDGFRVSTFTTAVEPRVARGLLGPLRVLHRLGVRLDVLSRLFDKGAPKLAAFAPKGLSSYA